MNCKQRTIKKLLQTLTICLKRESLIRDENIFFLQNSKINSNTQNFGQSKLSPSQDNKAIDVNNAPLDKGNRESIYDHSCDGNECNKIPDHELSNKIATDNGKNKRRINKNHQYNTNSLNNSRTIQNDVSRNDINNENVQKPSSRKQIYLVRDSIVKHVNGYDILSKTENSMFVHPSHGAAVRCMTDHVSPDHIVFHWH